MIDFNLDVNVFFLKRRHYYVINILYNIYFLRKSNFFITVTKHLKVNVVKYNVSI